MMNHNEKTLCHEILSRLNAYIDGELDPILCSHLEAHLSSCQDCQIVYSTLRKTIELCQQEIKEITLPPDVKERLVANLNRDNDVHPQG